MVRKRLAELAAPPPRLAVSELHYATYGARTHFGSLLSSHRLALDA
jgi:hypothetical protein